MSAVSVLVEGGNQTHQPCVAQKKQWPRTQCRGLAIEQIRQSLRSRYLRSGSFRFQVMLNIGRIGNLVGKCLPCSDHFWFVKCILCRCRIGGNYISLIARGISEASLTDSLQAGSKIFSMRDMKS